MIASAHGLEGANGFCDSTNYALNKQKSAIKSPDKKIGEGLADFLSRLLWSLVRSDKILSRRKTPVALVYSTRWQFFLQSKQKFCLVRPAPKFDCLIFEMLFIKELNRELNSRKDSIRAKLFTCLCVRMLCYLDIFTLLFVSPRNSFTFIFVLITLIIDLLLTLSGRRIVVAFLNI